MNYYTGHFASSSSAEDDAQASASGSNPASMVMPMRAVSNGNGGVYPQGLSLGQQPLAGPSGLQRGPSLSHRSEWKNAYRRWPKLTKCFLGSMNFDQSSSDPSRSGEPGRPPLSVATDVLIPSSASEAFAGAHPGQTSGPSLKRGM